MATAAQSKSKTDTTESTQDKVTEDIGTIQKQMSAMKSQMDRMMAKIPTQPVIEQAAQDGVENAFEEETIKMRQRAWRFTKHFVPTTKKELGMFVEGVALGFVGGGRTASSDWRINRFSS